MHHHNISCVEGLCVHYLIHVEWVLWQESFGRAVPERSGWVLKFVTVKPIICHSMENMCTSQERSRAELPPEITSTVLSLPAGAREQAQAGTGP